MNRYIVGMICVAVVSTALAVFAPTVVGIWNAGFTSGILASHLIGIVVRSQSATKGNVDVE